MPIDGRRPILLDHHGHVLEIVAGHADIFAVEVRDGRSGGRHHLFRIERGDIIPDLPGFPASSPDSLRFIAVGAQDTRVSVVPRTDLASADQAVRWIERLARFVAGPAPLWQMAELPEGELALTAGEARRGPMRGLLWLTVERGALSLIETGTSYTAGSPPLPLTSGLWVEAGADGCAAHAVAQAPAHDLIWPAIDQFHQNFVECVQGILIRDTQNESARLVSRTGLAATQAVEAFDRLSGIIVRRFDHDAVDASWSDRLAGACQIVGNAMRAPIAVSSRGEGSAQDLPASPRSRRPLACGCARCCFGRTGGDWMQARWSAGMARRASRSRSSTSHVRGYLMIDPLTKVRAAGRSDHRGANRSGSGQCSIRRCRRAP